MKKFLLSAAAALVVAGAGATIQPTVYDGLAFNGLSPNGNYAVSYSYETLTILDFEADKSYEYDELYGCGNGNYVSNTGIVVGYRIGFESACYFKNGQWYEMPGVDDHIWTYADGITPTGSRIVGSATPEGTSEINIDGLMLVPCYWDQKADGTYSDPIFLPHPNEDHTGRAPQYITAVRVSDDGKTIAGQIVDYSGQMCQPIVYTQGANGEWTYTLLLNNLFHPEGINLPENPGNEPSTNPQDFMTPAELAAYNAAVQDWENDCLESGDWDYNTMPDPMDYLSDAGKAELAKAEEEYQVWEEKYLAFEAALQELMDIVPAFEQNNVFLSTDGSLYATTSMKGRFDFETWNFITDNVPYLLNISDLKNVTYKTYPDEELNIIISTLADDGTLLGQTTFNDFVKQAYILPKGAEEFQPLYDYINGINPGIASWMKENMTHTYTAMDLETYETYEATDMFSGIPFATPDLKVFAFAVENNWYDWDNADAPDAEPYVATYGYIFSIDDAGVEGIEADGAITVAALPGAVLALTGDVARVTVYGINGACMFNASEPGATIATGLDHGIYVVRAVAADGKAVIRKVVF